MRRWIGLLAILSFSCAEEARRQDQELRYHVSEEIGGPLYLSQMYDSIEYVVLETSADCVLPFDLQKVKINSNAIYIFDGGALYVFSRKNGKFIFKIDKQGKGPGEYMTPEDFIIDTQQGKIEILERMMEKILVFDLEGNFIEEFSIPFDATSAEKISSGEYLFFLNNRSWQGEKFNLVYWEKETKKIREFIAIREPLKNVFFGSLQFLYQDDRSFYWVRENFSNKIYRYTRDGNIESHHFDFGDRWFELSNEHGHLRPRERYEEIKFADGIARIDVFIPHENIFSIAFNTKDGPLYGLGNFEDKTLQLHSNLINDIDSFGIRPIFNLWSSDGLQAKLISGLGVSKRLERNGCEKLPRQLRSYCSEVKKGDNGVVMIMHPKK